MPTFSSAPASVAYDKAASQPLGALSTGLGYDPTTATTATKATQYIGGAVETIGYGKGVAAVGEAEEEVPHTKAKK